MEQIGSISGPQPSDRRWPDWPAAQVVDAVSPTRLASICSQARFPEARRAAASQILQDHAANRLLNMVFNDRGRFMIGMLVQYLHHVRLEDEPDGGLTVGRLRRLCVQTGLSSPGRATAMMGVMRFAGYLAVAPGHRDRRQRIFVPTERMVALQRRRWSRHLTALSIIMPQGNSGLARLGEPLFEAAFLRHIVGAFVGGFRLGHCVPELFPYFERSAALITFIQLVELMGVEAASEMAPASISSLASQFGVSRAHVRKILDDAAADGFVARASGVGEPVVVLPPLIEAINRFFAASFLYTARCVDQAIADVGDAVPAAN